MSLGKTKRLLGVLALALVVVMVVQNTQVVEIRFLFWTWAMSRALLVLLVFAAGLLVGWALHAPHKPSR
jgi:uncharacterized integral membrane protein